MRCAWRHLAVKFKAPKETPQRAWMNVQALKIDPIVGFRPQDLLEETAVEDDAGTVPGAETAAEGGSAAEVDATPGPGEEGERPAKKAKT